MTRYVVAAVVMLGLGIVAVQEASALSARNRLCVQNARRAFSNARRTSRAKLFDEFQGSVAACFGGDGSDPRECVEGCQAVQSKCLADNVQTPRDLCDTSNDNDDGTVSCREQFTLDLDACAAKKLPSGAPDFDGQLVCQQAARLARFNCSQACAAGVAGAQDGCSVDFTDCIEFCG